MRTSFLWIVELSNGKNGTKVDALDKILVETGLFLDSLIEPGSDGASVMVESLEFVLMCRNVVELTLFLKRVPSYDGSYINLIKF